MRTLFASALLLLACGVAGGCADRSSRPSGASAPPSIPGGPDPIVLRVARGGGLLTAARYPALDTIIWRSAARLPSLSQVMAFGAEDGYLAAIDSSGAPIRVDFRLGAVSAKVAEPMRGVASFDGGSVYAVTAAGEITRFTPYGGDWSFRPPLPAHALFPQADGSLIVSSAKGDRAVVWRVRPPNQTITDSLSFDIGGDAATLARSMAATSGSVGDRIFFGANEMVIAVRSRDLSKALEVDMGDPVLAIAATPSGDRLFVALDDDRALRIVDRFEEGVSGKIRLPSQPLALRMDPLGRTLLVRAAGDSVHVVSLADDRVLGTVTSVWRGDLPLVLPDGAIATARGDDVLLKHPVSLADFRTVPGGAGQFWHALRWNGLRPRAKGLDQPVRFRSSAPSDSQPAITGDSAIRSDSTAATGHAPRTPAIVP